MASKYYVGKSIRTGQLETFRSAKTPTETSHGHIYHYVMGPFRTARGAHHMAKYGKNNPHLATVGQAERAAAAVAKRNGLTVALRPRTRSSYS